MGLIDGVIGGVTSGLANRATYGITDSVAKGVGGAIQKGMEKKCPKCKSNLTNPPGKFCAKCGEKLFKTCPKCKKEFLFDVQFCDSCGTKTEM